MRHYRSLDDVSLKNVWLTIGTYDGVHLGHQEIIRKVVAGARQSGTTAVVVTFYPPPTVVLRKRSDPSYLTLPENRAQLLGELGVDVVVTYPFNMEVAAMSAREFMSLLHKHLQMKHLCIGYDFALGHDREGNQTVLKNLGNEFGYSLQVFPPVKLDGRVVSSSSIRAHLASGEVEQAARLLGRPYQLSGEVVVGDGRGKSLGIPTANLSVLAERALPKSGVYICQVQFNGRLWGAVTNIGVRPTFENQPIRPQVEAHILDFESDIYGQEIELEFLAHIRDETRFPGPEALIQQIHQDIAQARLYLDSRV